MSMLIHIYKIGIWGFDVISIELLFLRVTASLDDSWQDWIEPGH